MSPRRTIVIGAIGQLGLALAPLLPDAEFLTQDQLDLALPDTISAFDWTGVGKSEEMAVVGAAEIIEHYSKLKMVFNHLLEEAARRKPQVVVVMDYHEFNLMLAKKLHKMVIPVVYYISPQIWAWQEGVVGSGTAAATMWPGVLLMTAWMKSAAAVLVVLGAGFLWWSLREQAAPVSVVVDAGKEASAVSAGVGAKAQEGALGAVLPVVERTAVGFV